MSTFGAGGVAKPFRSTNAAYEALKAWVLSAWKKHTELELPERTHKVMKEEEGLLHMAKKTIKDDPEDDEPHDIEFMTKPQRKINKHGNGTQCNEPTINNWDCFAKREWDECLTEDARIATVRDAYHVIHLKEVPETERGVMDDATMSLRLGLCRLMLIRLETEVWRRRRSRRGERGLEPDRPRVERQRG
ncbi:hypothetical protein B0A55_10249 [Friedmanniomyces simplex]|uniref:Uncharacterized protein n=1 Tax=Friedmanniomyces simplex TaxID=329884 RepID=A0A4V5ND55_9PEZI|nr:hypothetical protein B0A55_10249 [Friedmanniomyces simplex]